MTFVSIEFFFFFALLFPTFIVLRKLGYWTASKFLLLFASCLSYSYWFYPYILVLSFSIIVDFLCGQRIYLSKNSSSKIIFLTISLILNLSILGFFKYFNFFTHILVSSLAVSGIVVNSIILDLILPIGISFYTFQSMSYSIDIFRGRLKPTNSFLDFALFVSFFTQLVAGPIVRARQFIPQLKKPKTLSFEQMKWGLYLIILGMFKKLVIADNLAPYVDWFFSLPSYDAVHAVTAWLAVLAYAAQIFADFSGYTDIAIGLAWLLGFRLPANFYHPYIALGFRDFWHRWHITLSEWIRDYIYIPLGGNNSEQIGKTLRNLLLTMFLAGLWHGASWLFIIWGLLHGVFLIFDHILITPIISRLSNMAAMPRNFGFTIIRFGTFFCIIYAWIIFRSQSLSQVIDISQALFSQFSVPLIEDQPYGDMFDYWGIIYLMHIAVLLKFKDKLHRRFGQTLYFFSSIFMIFMLAYFRAPVGNAFIYFAF